VTQLPHWVTRTLVTPLKTKQLIISEWQKKLNYKKRCNCGCIGTAGRPRYASPFPLQLQRHAKFEVAESFTAIL